MIGDAICSSSYMNDVGMPNMDVHTDDVQLTEWAFYEVHSILFLQSSQQFY